MSPTVKYTILRPVTQEECPWLTRSYIPGEQIYTFKGNTYGCINYKKGFAATEDASGANPFFEFPFDAVAVSLEES